MKTKKKARTNEFSENADTRAHTHTNTNAKDEAGQAIVAHAERGADMHARYLSLLQNYGGRLRAVDPASFAALNVDVPQALATMHGVLPRLASMRGALADTFKSFDFERYDSIADYTDLLEYTHARYLSAAAARDRLPELAERASKEIAYMALAARLLASKGLVSGERIDEMQYAQAFCERGSMLSALALRLLDAWPAIEGRTTLTLDELNAAITLGHDVLAAAGQRNVRADACDEAAELRLRAFTLLDGAYKEARRALRFVRDAYGDADEIAPSLRVNAGPARRKSVEGTKGGDAKGGEQPAVQPKGESESDEGAKEPAKAQEKGAPA